MYLFDEKEKLYLKAMELREKYGYGYRKIAKILNISEATVNQWLYQGHSPHKYHHFDYNEDVKNYIDGLLMGDGHIQNRYNKAGVYEQAFSIKFKEWCDKIIKDFQKFGIICKTYNNNKRMNGKIYEIIKLYTLHYREFLIFRHRWYLNSKKKIPEDITITPEFILNWYLGDGSLYWGHNWIYAIKLFTLSFDKEDLYNLLIKIKNAIGITNIRLDRYKRYKNKFILTISGKREVIKFIDYLSVCEIPKCFEYKFNIK